MPELLNKSILEASNMRTLETINIGARQLTTKGIDVKHPDDLNGRKIRAPGVLVYQSYVRTLGGNPIPISYTELYMGLQTGTAQGQENPISNIMSVKLYEVQDTLVLTAHAPTMGMFVINEDVWKKIIEKDQKTIQSVFSKVIPEYEALAFAEEEGSIQKLKELGMTVVRQEDIDFNAFVKRSDKVVTEMFADSKYDGWRKYLQIAKEWVSANIK